MQATLPAVVPNPIARPRGRPPRDPARLLARNLGGLHPAIALAAGVAVDVRAQGRLDRVEYILFDALVDSLAAHLRGLAGLERLVDPAIIGRTAFRDNDDQASLAASVVTYRRSCEIGAQTMEHHAAKCKLDQLQRYPFGRRYLAAASDQLTSRYGEILAGATGLLARWFVQDVGWRKDGNQHDLLLVPFQDIPALVVAWRGSGPSPGLLELLDAARRASADIEAGGPIRREIGRLYGQLEWEQTFGLR